MPIEEVSLGKQPVVERQPDGTFKGRLAEHVEYRLVPGKSGKIKKGEAAELKGLCRKAIENQREREAKLESQFGKVKIADRLGNVYERRGDEAALLVDDPSSDWGKKATKSTFVVPACPWHKPKTPGAFVRCRIRYVNGERIEERITK